MSGGVEIVQNPGGASVVMRGLIGAINAVETLLPTGLVSFRMGADTGEDVQFRQRAERGREIGKEILIQQNLVAFQEGDIEEVFTLKTPVAFQTVKEFAGGMGQNTQSEPFLRRRGEGRGVLTVCGNLVEFAGPFQFLL